MRIVIEIDGVEPAAPAGKEREGTLSQQASQLVDGGAGPGEEGSLGAGMENDSGGPPQSLLDEIAAAEAAEQQSAGGGGDTAGADAGPPGQ